VFAVWLRLVPAGGFPGWNAGLWPALKALILPAVALALPQAAILARVTRSALVEVLGEDFIRTARAKGLPQKTVLWRHALRNALLPVLTILGLQFAFLLAGDRKSTRLNSSHVKISYAVFCLKKKKNK